MNDDNDAGRHRSRGRSRRACLLGVAAGIVVLTAACGSSASAGPGSASSAGSGSSSSSGGTSQAQGLAYSRCMRAHGVANFPDPLAGGGYGDAGRQAQSDPNFQSADNTCRSELGSGAEGKGQQNVTQFLQHAQCMRAHGVPNYPDPQLGVNPRTALQQAGINMNSPQVEAASQACAHFMPPRGASPSPGSTS